MTTSMQWAWGWLWLLVTMAVFSLPLWPGLRELKLRRDASPLPIDSDDSGDTAYRLKVLAPQLPELETMPEAQSWLSEGRYHIPREANVHAARVHGPLVLDAGAAAEILIADGVLEMKPGSQIAHLAHADSILCNEHTRLNGRASAQNLVVLAAGSQAFRLAAPCIVTAPLDEAPVEPAWTQPTQMIGVPHRQAGRCVLEAGKRLQRSLVVAGDLHLQDGAVVVGHVKVHGDLILERSASIIGAVFATGSIRCLGNNHVQGPISAGQRVELGPECRAGAPATPCSISGWDVRLGPGVAIFGAITTVGGCEVWGS